MGKSFAWAGLALSAVTACTAPRSLQGRDSPRAYLQMQTERPHAHYDSSLELPGDEAPFEPASPALNTMQERALAHVHGPRYSCSGVVVAPRLVVTAHQCLGNDVRGVTSVPPSEDFYVELAAPKTPLWNRARVAHAITPGCMWERLDLAILVLSAEAEVEPLRIVSCPSPGNAVQALGFGRCPGEDHALTRSGRVVRRDSDALVIDLGLCRGDVGGPIVNPATGDLLGVASHQDDPDNAGRRTTTFIRLDTTPARALIAQAIGVAQGVDTAQLDAVSCE